jgi:hypothetical protein
MFTFPERSTMPDPAFLVDGVMEQRIQGQICRGKPVQRLNRNGLHVPLSVIVGKIEFHIRLFNNRFHPIVILIDREKRKLTCERIVEEIEGLLKEHGYAGQFVVGVVDRCIENWILADWDSVRIKFSGYQIKQVAAGFQTEGIQGKAAIKRLLPEEILYNEPTWGKDMFLSCRPDEIYRNSASFRNFIDKLNLPCPWLGGVSDRFRAGYE